MLFRLFHLPKAGFDPSIKGLFTPRIIMPDNTAGGSLE